MAEKSRRHTLNVQGRYYVDENCIACDACVAEAPMIFKMNDEEGHAYVARQPKNDQEREAAENALYTCPTGAIGNDGE